MRFRSDAAEPLHFATDAIRAGKRSACPGLSFVGGMDLFRAIVFSVMLTIVNIMLASFFMMSAIATTVGEPI